MTTPDVGTLLASSEQESSALAAGKVVGLNDSIINAMIFLI